MLTVYDQNDNLVGEANLSETNKFDLIDGEYVWDLGTLPPGEYTVIETADLDGYTRTTTYKVDSNAPATGTTASVTLVTDQNHVVEFDNTYTEQRDNLKIKKTFAGAELTDEEKANVDALSGATMSLSDAHGDILGALLKTAGQAKALK